MRYAEEPGRPPVDPGRRRTPGPAWAALTVAALTLLATAAARSAVKLDPLFTAHAVLQRDRPVPVWGTAEANEPVTVTFAGQTAAATADAAGHWSAKLPPMPASAAPATLTVAGRPGDPPVTLDDLLIGDVWLCTGQSNMERPLSLRPPQPPVNDADREIAAANYPTIRLFTVTEGGTATPRAGVRTAAGWEPCTPETAAKFSAVGYFFGRDVQATARVPIGLICSTVGGTPVAAWTSRPALESTPEFAPLVADWERQVAAYPAIRAKWDAAHAAATQPTKTRAVRPANPSVRGTTTLFNGMIAPLVPYAIRGAIWYQGESDAAPPAQAEHYRRLFPLMVADWRARWGQGDFPFLFVQVAPYRDTPPLVRESQRLSLAAIPNGAMVVITDAGEADNIHPRAKQVVGQRLALAARAVAYGEPVEFSGPMYKSAAFADGKATVAFDHVGRALVARGGPLRGFELAGPDGKFVPAVADIAGPAVVVHADAVPAPTAVRFGWSAVPDLNLFNADGLPASPFTSEAAR